MITHIIIQPIRDNGQLEKAKMIQVKNIDSMDYSKIYVEVDGIDGSIKILTEKQLCKLCGGEGGTRYWYEQDHSVAVDCPICNGGSQEKWDKEKADWQRHTGEGR